MPDRYTPIIVASALSDPIRVINRHAGNVSEICQLAGVDHDATADGTISLRRFVRFSEQAAQELRHPEFGWEVGSEFDLRNIGAVGQFVLEAPTLGDALSLLTRSFAMVQSDSTLELRVSGHEAVLSYRILDLNIWPRNQDVELTIALLLGLLKQAAGRDWRPTRIAFEHDTSPVWKNSEMGPRCNVDYLAPDNSIVFPAKMLDLPLHTAQKTQFIALSRALSDESRKLERQAPVTVQVRREIAKRFGQEKLDQTDIARALGYSRRTLRRRLELEGYSFSSVLTDCRIRRAEHMLGLPDVPLSLIAEHLGYADISPFERAFRTRKGVTPAQYRKLRQTRAGAKPPRLITHI